jgi:hypothetical protein
MRTASSMSLYDPRFQNMLSRMVLITNSSDWANTRVKKFLVSNLFPPQTKTPAVAGAVMVLLYVFIRQTVRRV